MSQRFWLFKTEPEVFSIGDLAKLPRRTTCWDGVRNYQARNLLRDGIQVGDAVLIYHSNANPPAVMGTAEVVRAAYPDHTSWNPESDHFDAKSTSGSPRWYMVDIRLRSIFKRPLGLKELKEIPQLSGMELLRKGSRLSIQPVRASEFDKILELSNEKPRRKV